MSRTILYYNIHLTLNGEKTSVPLTNLINEVNDLDEVERFWNSKKLSLLFLKLIDITNPLNANNRSFAIAKYRDSYKPYTGRIGTNEATPIVDDVIEFTCCHYLKDPNILIIEYNHNGSRPNDVARYFSSFLPKVEGNFWDIELEPIDAERGLQTLREARKINSIELKIDCTQTIATNFPAGTFFANFLPNLIESHREFGANVAVVKFGNGRKRLDIIEGQHLIQMISILDLDDEIFQSVKVDFIDSDGIKDIIDLKNSNILRTIIMEGETITSYEYIIDQIEISHLTNNRPGELAFRRFTNLIHNQVLPNIIAHENIRQTIIEDEGA